MDSVYAAYREVLKEHPSGYAPVYKVRRLRGWSRERFDERIADLNQRDRPVVELHRGDPQRYTEAQDRDSLRLRGRVYRLMRWRDTEVSSSSQRPHTRRGNRTTNRRREG